jgi:hypothetical protein
MKTVLVTTSYHYDGKIESFTRAYLPTAEESAVAQAEDWAQKAKIVFDAGTALSHTSALVTPESLRATVHDRSERIAMIGRICALEAVAAGAPPIPEGQTYEAWRANSLIGDLDFLGEVEGVVPDGDWLLFQDSYLKNLFDASPCGPEE